MAKWATVLKKIISSRTVYRLFIKAYSISNYVHFYIDYLIAEPGYYEKNEFGIRLESIMRVIRKSFEVNRQHFPLCCCCSHFTENHVINNNNA